jgi:hypothetical protein
MARLVRTLDLQSAVDSLPGDGREDPQPRRTT